jgi:glycerol-3-phosphate acyltransferase PlsX
LLVAVDAMGGDHAPLAEIAGARAAAAEGIEVLLVGDERRLRAAGSGELAVLHASEIVTMDDHPAQAFRAKRDSSLRVAVDAVKSGRAAAMVSAGNSGAVLAHALLVLGRLPGVDRPAIVTVFPTAAGPLTLCDAGANVDVKPAMLAQFALLGAAYDRAVNGRARPRVGLLSNGSEEGKGTELTRAAHALLAALPGDGAVRYLGYVEGTDLFRGAVDVVATDGFTGNVVLKTAEGLAEAFLGFVHSELAVTARGRVGGAVAAPALKRLRSQIHYAETGGALLAGVDGVVMLAHGRSDATAIKNAIRGAVRLAGSQIHRKLAESVASLTA